MKRHAQQERSHWLAEFLCGLIGGTMALYSFIGWVFVAVGWLTPCAMLILCGGFGTLFGWYMAAETIRENPQKH